MIFTHTAALTVLLAILFSFPTFAEGSPEIPKAAKSGSTSRATSPSTLPKELPPMSLAGPDRAPASTSEPSPTPPRIHKSPARKLSAKSKTRRKSHSKLAKPAATTPAPVAIENTNPEPPLALSPDDETTQAPATAPATAPPAPPPLVTVFDPVPFDAKHEAPVAESVIGNSVRFAWEATKTKPLEVALFKDGKLFARHDVEGKSVTFDGLEPGNYAWQVRQIIEKKIPADSDEATAPSELPKPLSDNAPYVSRFKLISREDALNFGVSALEPSGRRLYEPGLLRLKYYLTEEALKRTRFSLVVSPVSRGLIGREIASEAVQSSRIEPNAGFSSKDVLFNKPGEYVWSVEGRDSAENLVSVSEAKLSLDRPSALSGRRFTLTLGSKLERLSMRSESINYAADFKSSHYGFQATADYSLNSRLTLQGSYLAKLMSFVSRDYHASESAARLKYRFLEMDASRVAFEAGAGLSLRKNPAIVYVEQDLFLDGEFRNKSWTASLAAAWQIKRDIGFRVETEWALPFVQTTTLPGAGKSVAGTIARSLGFSVDYHRFWPFALSLGGSYSSGGQSHTYTAGSGTLSGNFSGFALNLGMFYVY